MDSKFCPKCKEEKSISGFSPDKTTKSGFASWCKECHAEYARNRRLEFPELVRSQFLRSVAKNSEHIKEVKSVWKQENRDRINEQQRSRYANISPEKKEIRKQKRMESYAKNKEREQELHKLWLEENKDNLFLKISSSLRKRLGVAIRSNQKSGSAVRDLGCSIDAFKEYIASKFQPGMSWDNWGLGPGKWHIDHIIPLSAFDLTQRQHLILACYYLNMQPMWSEENISKGNRY